MRKADKPIRKVTLNLYTEDIKDMEHYYGRGWTEIVRNLVFDHTVQKRMQTIREMLDAYDD